MLCFKFNSKYKKEKEKNFDFVQSNNESAGRDEHKVVKYRIEWQNPIDISLSLK